MNFHNIQKRPSILIYKDLVRLIRLVMNEQKQIAVLAMVRKEFEKNRKLKEDSEILQLKNNAAKAMSDLYIFYIKESIKDDPKNPKHNLI